MNCKLLDIVAFKIDKSNVIIIIPRLYSDLSCHITKKYSRMNFILLFIKILVSVASYSFWRLYNLLLYMYIYFIIARLRGYFYFHSLTAFSPNNKRLFIFFLTKQQDNMKKRRKEFFPHLNHFRRGGLDSLEIFSSYECQIKIFLSRIYDIENAFIYTLWASVALWIQSNLRNIK